MPSNILMMILSVFVMPNSYWVESTGEKSWRLFNANWVFFQKLEQLERLHSENTPRCPMITYAMHSYQIPGHNKTRSKLQIQKICQKFKFRNFTITFTWHTFLSCLIKYANMKWIRLVSWKIQVITCDTPSDANDELCQIWKECKQNCRFF